MQLDKMSPNELRAFSDQIDQEFKRREKQDRAKAVENIYAIAHSMGVPLAELLKDSTRMRAPATKPTKVYRDPANPENRWIGKGPRPRWLKQAIEGGKTLESLLVEG
jgi:DNA-binding protein H-NS